MATARTAFVTGATGFLGLNVVEALLAEGWRVTALHRARSNVSRLQRLAGVELAAGALRGRRVGSNAPFHPIARPCSTWRAT